MLTIIRKAELTHCIFPGVSLSLSPFNQDLKKNYMKENILFLTEKLVYPAPLGEDTIQQLISISCVTNSIVYFVQVTLFLRAGFSTVK